MASLAECSIPGKDETAGTLLESLSEIDIYSRLVIAGCYVAIVCCCVPIVTGEAAGPSRSGRTAQFLALSTLLESLANLIRLGATQSRSVALP